MPYILPDPYPHSSEFQLRQFIIVRNFLPDVFISRWRALAERCVQKYGKNINHTVAGITLKYRVVTGEMIRDHFVELFKFYCSQSTLKWMATVIGANKLFTSNHITSAININSMQQPTERYPWHFDAIPYTAMLYLTSSEVGQGGALEVYPNLKIAGKAPSEAELNSTEKLQIVPEAGMLILMNGACCYHSVAPLLKSANRLSVPMVFPTTLVHERAIEVDEFIYDDV